MFDERKKRKKKTKLNRRSKSIQPNANAQPIYFIYLTKLKNALQIDTNGQLN